MKTLEAFFRFQCSLKKKNVYAQTHHITNTKRKKHKAKKQNENTKQNRQKQEQKTKTHRKKNSQHLVK